MHLLFRLVFRIASLALKFALTIVIARTLGFAAVADYGLAVAVSVVSSKLLGLGFSTEINRRLSGENASIAIHEARRLLSLYCVVYFVIAAVVWLIRVGVDLPVFAGMSRGVLVGIMLVAFSEHLGLETTSYVFSLHRPRLGSFLLFIRTGAWAGVAIIALLSGAVRSIESILTLWWVTNVVAALGACGCLWNHEYEGKRFARAKAAGSVTSVRTVWLDGLPFFVATTVLSCLQYGERFIASGIITADQLGRYVFAWSVANSIQTIAYATVVVTTGPRLVRSLGVATADFRAVLRSSARTSICITVLAAAAILALIQPIFRMAHEPVDGATRLMLSTLLISFVLRSIADIYWSAAIALRLGKQVFVVISAVAIFSMPLEWLSVARLGAVGAAFAHLMVSAAIVASVLFVVTRCRERQDERRQRARGACP
ncbi:polysaccharide biosynthesis protein [Paraburkholderia sp. PREW-6R]|uniref:lipopolysaccharide biosynthesis protein n=1 Tax=Paraburkholderia sp. PREW-6R TaxID=3141544 RepID=UPI0031F4D54A